jgi:hypothetical protein
MYSSGYQRMTDQALQVLGEKTPPPMVHGQQALALNDIGVVS